MAEDVELWHSTSCEKFARKLVKNLHTSIVVF
jgi:hypothetical protein